MGYRNYLGKISKVEHSEIKAFSYKMLVEKYSKYSNEEAFVSMHDFIKEIYELGKYCQFDLDSFTSDFFTESLTTKYFNSDKELFILSKEGFEQIIKSYADRTTRYYEKLAKPFISQDGSYDILPLSDTKAEKEIIAIIECIRNKVRAWAGYGDAYDLTAREEITTSWDIEYAIFELIRIYKSFDWDKDFLIYYGS